MTQFWTHFFKYGLVGGINALVTILLYWFLLKQIHLHYLAAFSISWISGVFLTYVINFVWVFKPEDKITFRARLLKYGIVYGISCGANMILLRICVTRWMWDPFWAQMVIIPLVVILNFSGIKYWALRPDTLEAASGTHD